jgi:hypothetical protein
MPIANNNKMILYGGIGLAVLVVIIIVCMMMKKKEGFNSWGGGNGQGSGGSAYTNLVGATTYTIGEGNMGTGNYAQGSSLMLESDANGNLSTSATLPIGAIILWAGKLNTIPVGWALCDGNNGTPNLTSGGFPRGVGSDAYFGIVGFVATRASDNPFGSDTDYYNSIFYIMKMQ